MAISYTRGKGGDEIRIAVWLSEDQPEEARGVHLSNKVKT